MALTIEERTKVWRGIMRLMSSYPSLFVWDGDLTKFDLYDPSLNSGAIADADNWTEANQSSFVSSLDQAFRDGTSAEIKVLILCAIVAMRVSEDFARKILGGLE